MASMIFILDTDTLIYMIRGVKATGRRLGRRERALELVERCRLVQKEKDVIGVSAITVSELEFGARKSGHYNEEIAAVQKILAPFETFDYSALKCAPFYGLVRHELEQAGQTIGAMDLLIAAHALSLDATVVTNNLAHFSRVPDLKVTDWR
jgi:tRNA(fMet)-specific endonuclease VapC